MCGRYRLAKDWTEVEHRFGAKLADAVKPLEPRYNIAPTDEVVAIRRRKDEEQPEARLLRWGLIPHWAKDAKSGATMINAKAETLLERPAFRTLVETHRCLIPAEGFYEWRTNEATGKREPFDLTVDDGGLFAFAGLWAARKDEAANEWLVSYTPGRGGLRNRLPRGRLGELSVTSMKPADAAGSSQTTCVPIRVWCGSGLGRCSSWAPCVRPSP